MIWSYILDKLCIGHRVIFLITLESKGSSPGRQGFKMAVADDDSMYGSIGGGIMEHKFVELAKSRLNDYKVIPSVHDQVHSKDSPNQSGMICSGEQTLLLIEVQQDERAIIESIKRAVQSGTKGVITITSTGIKFENSEEIEKIQFVRVGENEFVYKEQAGFPNQLHIVGGGHCSLALSKLFSNLEFEIYVYEERGGLNTFVSNNYASKKLEIDSYRNLHNFIPEGNNIYVIIMTFGYRSDDIAIRALLDKNFKYLGMIGSSNKIKKMIEQYKKEEIDEGLLQKIHAPAGIMIKSETPYEIAISIAAEIISIKNKL